VDIIRSIVIKEVNYGMKQYNISFMQLQNKWVMKAEDSDEWIRSSYYKSLAIRKGAKVCKNSDYPTMLVIYHKDKTIDEVRRYHVKEL
jgi:hypothetical protein